MARTPTWWAVPKGSGDWQLPLPAPKTVREGSCCCEGQRCFEDRPAGGQAVGGRSGGTPPLLGPCQLSLPPLPFCSEAVALLRFPVSFFRTLSRVCELSRIWEQRREMAVIVPPAGSSPSREEAREDRQTGSAGPLFPESSPKPLPRTLERQVNSGPYCWGSAAQSGRSYRMSTEYGAKNHRGHTRSLHGGPGHATVLSLLFVGTPGQNPLGNSPVTQVPELPQASP